MVQTHPALYKYIFWNNHHENMWYAIDRDTAMNFFSGNRKNSVYIQGNLISSLIKYIIDNDNRSEQTVSQ